MIALPSAPAPAMDRYVVVGNPVAHSLSPRIHAAFAAQLGEAMRYEAVEAPLDGFEATLRALLEDGLAGANVTVPFKGEAAAFADVVDAAAARAGAVNTLRREADGSVSGFNTDGAGLVRDLAGNLGVALRGARVVLLGAGGAAAGVVEPLLAAGVTDLAIWNRTTARAEALVERFGALGPVRSVGDGQTLVADLVVNATAASLAGDLPAGAPEAVGAGTFAYDMMYGPPARAFLDRARARGAAGTADGLGMLVEQAAEAFALWRGRRPDTAPVLADLRAGTAPT